MKEPAYYRPPTPLWVIVVWLVLMLIVLITIPFRCSDNPRWNIGD